jgi:NhaP-type Na+/H+ or K+/H+ antiporter
MEHLLVGLASIVVLGIAAQWISWRLRMPAILVLLVVGFVAGPVAGFVHPDALLGDLVFPLVSLSVAVILFEGGLSLDIAELRDLGRVIGRLLTVGALVTWALSTVFAILLLGLPPGIALLFGAVLIVTGPTVIIPLLRHIRPTARVGSAVKWEGIVNDPVGAILGVLVFEALIAGGLEAGLSMVVPGMMNAAVVGTLIGLAAASVVVLLMYRHWLPDYLESPVALALVFMAFAGANHLQQESGLLAVTVMGSALASQKLVSVHGIVEFKENLRVLLIAVLFIILAARLPLTDPDYFGMGSIGFFLALVLVVRPAAVLASTWGSSLNWRERTFIAAMAPRGIVAAAVSDLRGDRRDGRCLRDLHTTARETAPRRKPGRQGHALHRRLPLGPPGSRDPQRPRHRGADRRLQPRQRPGSSECGTAYVSRQRAHRRRARRDRASDGRHRPVPGRDSERRGECVGDGAFP